VAEKSELGSEQAEANATSHPSIRYSTRARMCVCVCVLICLCARVCVFCVYAADVQMTTKIGKFLARGKTQSVPDVFAVACTTHVDTYHQQRVIQRAGQ